MSDNTIPRALTIAGSDSGGGAGIQADLKTFAMLGVHGMSAITSVTAQNTVRVSGVHDLPPEFVAEQIDRVAEDIGIDAAKTGMLSNAGIVRAVAEAVRRHRVPNLVVDPVMVAKSGDALLREDAREAVLRELAPLAFVITPNVPEAEVLAGMSIGTHDDLREAARRIAGAGPKFVLMKGGHLEGDAAVDYLYDGTGFTEFTAPRVDTKNTHGTGCTFSAAIAAYLARGMDTPGAVGAAKKYLTEAIRRGLPLGAGHGPLCHQWPLLDGVRP
jgi:hydroxymethylpyrimidine/phosphomethylpyrimidine kinase